MYDLIIPIYYKKPNHSHSALNNFCRCKRLYLLSSLFKSLMSKKPLVVGSGVHSGLEEWYLTKNVDKTIEASIQAIKEYNIQDELDEQEYIDIVISLLLSYIEEYSSDTLNVITTETKFNHELAPGIMFKGKIDGIVEQDGKYILLEHKTSSWTPKSLFASFEGRSRQIETYIWAAKKTFADIGGVDSILINGIFKGNSRRSTSFERRTMRLPDSRLESWREETISMIKDIQICYEKYSQEGFSAFYPDFDRCMDYHTECEFKPFCDTCDIDSLSYTHVPKVFKQEEASKNEKELK